ncbi:unnamed protein product [Darwinula stevensoni]|uniref:CARD domain-containing protein n=1 Tax=Darwinula stevensoni TaxID=69355 RepID=A0A7R8XAV7_9CRUS|nr:unnamed protein product [Darwinula stevensoni]CAG0890405.1 unnamed protein product [Darwinula stevensoni]
MGGKSFNACLGKILARYSDELHFIQIDKVLSDLHADGIVDYAEYIEVGKKNLKEKVLFIQECLPRSRDGAFSTFVEILRKRNHVDLAEKLKGELEKALKVDEDPMLTRDSEQPSAGPDTSKLLDVPIAGAALEAPPPQTRTCQQMEAASQDIREPDAVRGKFPSNPATPTELYPVEGAMRGMQLSTSTLEQLESECRCGNDLGEVASPTECQRIHGFDICDNLKICTGGDNEIPFMEGAELYIQQHYPNAGECHYSLPSGLLLKAKNFDDLLSKAEEELTKPDGKDVMHLPLEHEAVAVIFNRLKDICGSAPSLVVADYVFSETFNRDGTYNQTLDKMPTGEKEKLKEDQDIPELKEGSHNIFFSYTSGDKVYNVFFQTRQNTSLKLNRDTVKRIIAKAKYMSAEDRAVFKAVCGSFLESAAVVVAFPSFPFIDRGQLHEVLRCESCERKVLTGEDVQNPDALRRFLQKNGLPEPTATGAGSTPSAKKLFREIFSLYICASSSVAMPRTNLQLFQASNKQIERTLCILTPEQKRLVDERSSWLLPLAGGSGTGKTIVVKERAKRLAREDPTGEVLVVNLPGGRLTEDFRYEFRGEKNIKVLDGKEHGIKEDREGFFAFLREQGEAKHVLLDEVPLTLGVQGHMHDKSLSEEWAEISNLEKHMKTLTLAFRPNDATYTRDINLEIMRIGGASMNILNVVKRNTRLVSDLFLAIADYSRRIFVCEEPTMQDIDFCQSNNEYLPTLFPIPSCPNIHDFCENVSTCEAMRASVAILMIRESSGSEKPLYVVVDSKERRDRLINILDHVFDTEVTWMDSYERFRGPPDSSIIVFTDAQILGCHQDCVFVIMDLADCKWRNYIRMVSSCYDNVTIVMEQEALRTGKYFQIEMTMPALMKEKTMTIQEKFMDSLNRRLEQAWKLNAEEIAHLEEKNSPKRTFFLKRVEIFPSDIDWSHSKLNVIFGPPSSGKSMLIIESIQRLLEPDHGTNRVLLLHMGGPLSWKVSLEYLHPYTDKLDVVRWEAWSPQNLIDNHVVAIVRWKYPDSTIHVYVDDYLIQAKSANEIIQNWTEILDGLKENDQKLTLTIAFQSHSRFGREVFMKELSSFFEKVGAQDGCQFCREIDGVTSPSECPREAGCDVRDYLQVNVEVGIEKPFKESAEEYIQQHYPKAGKIHYSLPLGFLPKSITLDTPFRMENRSLEKNDGEERDLPPDDQAIAIMFDRVKDVCGSAPSLLLADYKLSNLNKALARALSEVGKVEEKTQRNSTHDIYLSYPAVEEPQTPTIDFQAAHAQMQSSELIWDPQQMQLMNEDERSSWLLLIAGGSGTGKTTVLLQRAKRLARNGKVVFVNVAGGLLTQILNANLQGESNIKVVDGREEGILENLEAIISFLHGQGEGKHALLDEVPLTLGYQGDLDEMSLSNHWAKISALRGDDVKVILDLGYRKWRNFVRLISSCHDNVIIVIEEDGLLGGKYSEMKVTVWGMAPNKVLVAGESGFREKMHEYCENVYKYSGKVWQEDKDITQLSENTFNPTIAPESTKKVFHESHASGFCSAIACNPSRTSVIFGPPCSGKSMVLLQSIQRLAVEGQDDNLVLLLNMGSALSLQVSRDLLQWKAATPHVFQSEPLFPKDIINFNGLQDLRHKYPHATIHIHVDDYLIQAKNTEEEIKNWVKVLDNLKQMDQKLTLTIAFQSHSRWGQQISGKKLGAFFGKMAAQVIILPEFRVLPSFTSNCLLTHIFEHENRTPLGLVAMSLSTESFPGAIARGLKPKYITMTYCCTGNHLSYSCKGQKDCSVYMVSIICFRYALMLVSTVELIHVLVSDMKLLTILQAINEEPSRILFLHPQDFRGCECYVSIAVNVEDCWLLDSLSRARTNLIIIDSLPDHQQVWRIMEKDGLVEVHEVTEGIQIDKDTLFKLDSVGRFLRRRNMDYGETMNRLKAIFCDSISKMDVTLFLNKLAERNLLSKAQERDLKSSRKGFRKIDSIFHILLAKKKPLPTYKNIIEILEEMHRTDIIGKLTEPVAYTAGLDAEEYSYVNISTHPI